jgi:hypothetical protein
MKNSSIGLGMERGLPTPTNISFQHFMQRDQPLYEVTQLEIFLFNKKRNQIMR